MGNIFYAKDKDAAIKYAKRRNNDSGVNDFDIKKIRLAKKQDKHSAGWKTFTDS